MNVYTADRIAYELATLIHRPGAPSNRARNDERRPWLEDYGIGKQIAQVDAARLSVISGGGDYRSGGTSSKDQLASGRFAAFRHEMMHALCPGTKVLAVCLGVAAFIVVI